MNAVNGFEGVKEGGILVLNTTHDPKDMEIPKNIASVTVVDATKIALDMIGRPITNTVMLGAFCKATGLVSVDEVAKKVEELWGAKNKEALYKGYEAAVTAEAR